MSASLAFVFPGQGSQSLGMLAEHGAGSSLVLDTFSEASAALGYDLRLVNLQEQDEDLIITWPIAVGLFTEEQIRNFPVNSEYGYAFRFPTNPDGTPVQIEEPNLITAADVSSLPPTGTLSTP